MSKQLKWARGVAGLLCILLMMVLTVHSARGEDDPVVAKIGDTVITLSKFTGQVKQKLSAKDQHRWQQINNVLDDMLTDILFSKEAVEEGLDKEPANMTAIKDVSEDKRVEVLAGAYKAKFLIPVKVTEQEAAEFYVNNLNLYNMPKIYGGYMFSVEKKDVKDNDCTQTCKDLAQEVYSRFDSKFDTEAFIRLKEELTAKYPDLKIVLTQLSHWEGKVKDGPYVKALKEFVQMKKGETKMSEAQDRYIVVSLTSIYEPEIYRFEEVKSRVIADMERNSLQKKYNETLKRLAEKYKLYVNPQFIELAAKELKNKPEDKSNE
ncbi:hypothetical protein [Candidatus Magnetobacterium casense]|uniref:PpiC domain-containing protein n=1 Tax=Candidatus Magnetobacterium casense TaxID=1455061 RepID=A0ABS6RTY3_9BACT|nr:hypothetical protein [Candidatus Magnetobacterium casensis]MBV6340081.1 hypothetical protein [Candidatus Magnetobacterium casensis]